MYGYVCTAMDGFFYVCMVINVCMCGYVCMAMYEGLCMHALCTYGYVCMAMYEGLRMVMNACRYGFLHIVSHYASTFK